MTTDDENLFERIRRLARELPDPPPVSRGRVVMSKATVDLFPKDVPAPGQLGSLVALLGFPVFLDNDMAYGDWKMVDAGGNVIARSVGGIVGDTRCVILELRREETHGSH
jgi:hypothetical protein